MSKTCHECENCIYPPMCDNTLCPISDENFAKMCNGFTQIQKPKPTNGDEIRELSNEGIAAVMCGLLNSRDDSVFEAILNYLNSPAESDGWEDK